ncbi:MAG TPA: HxsD-like protein [Elusimicrobiales bacterium]|nr:HxsD-like protein [Elusimicrobiales bacterium]
MAEKRKPKKVSVKFHCEIYKEAGVKAAAQAYSGFAGFTVTRKGSYILAVITPKGGELPATLEGEFINRALFNSI